MTSKLHIFIYHYSIINFTLIIFYVVCFSRTLILYIQHNYNQHVCMCIYIVVPSARGDCFKGRSFPSFQPSPRGHFSQLRKLQLQEEEKERQTESPSVVCYMHASRVYVHLQLKQRKRKREKKKKARLRELEQQTAKWDFATLVAC